jgi:hypothetical protein
MKESENRMLGVMFGPKRKEVAGELLEQCYGYLDSIITGIFLINDLIVTFECDVIPYGEHERHSPRKTEKKRTKTNQDY